MMLGIALTVASYAATFAPTIYYAALAAGLGEPQTRAFSANTDLSIRRLASLIPCLGYDSEAIVQLTPQSDIEGAALGSHIGRRGRVIFNKSLDRRGVGSLKAFTLERETYRIERSDHFFAPFLAATTATLSAIAYHFFRSIMPVWVQVAACCLPIFLGYMVYHRYTAFTEIRADKHTLSATSNEDLVRLERFAAGKIAAHQELQTSEKEGKYFDKKGNTTLSRYPATTRHRLILEELEKRKLKPSKADPQTMFYRIVYNPLFFSEYGLPTLL